MIKVGVVGFGLSSKVFHIPFIGVTDGMQLCAISTSKIEDAKTQYPDTEVFTDHKKMITECELDLVVITAPNHVHFTLSKLCLESGKHVILEKPIVTRSEDGQKLLELSKQHQKLVIPYQNRRWDGDFLTLKALIDKGTLGDIKVFESHFDRFRPIAQERWQDSGGEGGGILYGLGPHLIDQALFLFGLPSAVTARSLVLRENTDGDDYFHVQLHYEDKEVILNSSCFAAAPNLRFNVQGTKGAFVKYGLDPQEAALRNGQSPSEPDWGKEPDQDFGIFYNGTDSQTIATTPGCYQQYYSLVQRAVANNTAPPVTLEDAVDGLKILEYCQLSQAQKKTIGIRKYR